MRIIRRGRKKYKTCITNYNSQQYCELLVWIDVKKAQDAVDCNWLRERMAYHRFAKWIHLAVLSTGYLRKNLK